MSGGVVKMSGEMAARQSDRGIVEFVQKRSFESMERPDDDAAEVRPLVSRPLSRLQKRAPAKMQLRRVSPDSMGLPSRSPIPLLSPILVLPFGGGDLDRLLLTGESPKQKPEEEEKSVVNSHVIPTNGWQHPAALFLGERVCSFSNCFL